MMSRQMMKTSNHAGKISMSRTSRQVDNYQSEIIYLVAGLPFEQDTVACVSCGEADELHCVLAFACAASAMVTRWTIPITCALDTNVIAANRSVYSAADAVASDR